MAEPAFLVLELSKTPPDYVLEVHVWFSRLIGAKKQKALAATVPQPFSAPVVWPGPNVMRLAVPDRPGWSNKLKPWARRREKLLDYLSALHDEAPIAFAKAHRGFSIMKDPKTLVEVVIPALLAYFAATSASQATADDPGAGTAHGSRKSEAPKAGTRSSPASRA